MKNKNKAVSFQEKKELLHILMEKIHSKQVSYYQSQETNRYNEMAR